MNRTLLAGTALCAAIALPAIAQAASGFSTANVNMRSGPSTAYPAVTLIPVGQPLRINGCLQEVPWCDVSFAGGRGWVAGRYIQVTYQQRRIYVGPEYYRPLGIPTVEFNLDNYWDRYYRGRPFYRDRDRWDRGPDWSDNGDDQNWGRRPPPPPPPGYDRQDDGDQGNWQRRDRWRRQPGYDQPGYNNRYGDDGQGDNNPPRPPRYRQPDNNGQQFDGNPPPPSGSGAGGNMPRPPRQQNDGQQGQGRQDQGRPQGQGQMQPPPPGQPPRQQPQAQPQQQPPAPPAPGGNINPNGGNGQNAPRGPQNCAAGGKDCPPVPHNFHN